MTNTCKAPSLQRPLGLPFHVPVAGPRQTRIGVLDISATAANHHLLLCIVEQVLVTGDQRHRRLAGRAGGFWVNRFKSRSSAVTVALAACGLAAAAALSGCGAGQVAQTATQQPAVNGTAGDGREHRAAQCAPAGRADDRLRAAGPRGGAALRGVQRVPGQPGQAGVGITSDVGTVTVSGDTTLPPSGVLVVGEPDGQIAPLESAETAEAAKATVDLTKPITNGLTYNFTFTFEKAGETTVPVPISAGEAPRRDGSGESGRRHRRSPLTNCRPWRIPSHRGQGAFAVPLLRVPPCHREMGRPLPGLRHLGNGRRSSCARRRQRVAGPACRGTDDTGRADQLHRSRRDQAPSHGRQRTRPRAGRRHRARLGDAAGR